MKYSSSSIDLRSIRLRNGTAAIPERLLLQHARGEVLFIVGAGASMQANVPDFRELVISVYKILDTAVYSLLKSIPRNICDHCFVNTSGLEPNQAAEIKRFISGEYDVCLGMLERRMDGEPAKDRKVRNTVEKILRTLSKTPATIHRALMKLADRGAVTTIATTNFELLLEKAAKKKSTGTKTYSLDGIPRPTRRGDFAGVLHIHGALNRNQSSPANFILTDRDFGEYYLRRRTVPDFIYDAARLFNLVLVGYSANDPPMKYLLNAVAADGSRFDDLKERYAFVGTGSSDPISKADWEARGITPIMYDSADQHVELEKTILKWSEISPVNGGTKIVDTEIKRIIKNLREESSDLDRDLFDHLVRRGDINDSERIAKIISMKKVDIEWSKSLMAIMEKKE